MNLSNETETDSNTEPPCGCQGGRDGGGKEWEAGVRLVGVSFYT